MLWHIINKVAQRTSSLSSSPILPLKETIGLEAQQRTTSKTLNEKKATKTSVKSSTNA